MQATEKTNPITTMPIKNLKPAAYNPENRMNSTPMNRLVKSIDSIGLVYPIAINEKREVIDGHRRLTACKELGWDKVPTVVVTGDRDAIYAETNANSMRMSAYDNLCIYLKNAAAVTPRIRASFERCESAIGRPLLEKMAKKGYGVKVYRWAQVICRHLECVDDIEFVKKTILWCMEHRAMRPAWNAVKANINPATLRRAINNNRPLKEKYALA